MGYVSRQATPTSLIEIGSDLDEDVFSISTVQTNYTLSNIPVPNFAGTIRYAYLDLMIGAVQNTNAAANYLVGGQNIQVDCAAVGYIDAITLENLTLYCPASTTLSGGVFKGNIDIKSRVIKGDTLNVKWTLSQAHADNLIVYFTHPILRCFVGA